jgi:uncharacterized membrane protein
MMQQWELRRNCSISPRQLAMVFGSLSTVCLLIAAFFWFVGAPFVMLFAGVEILALGTAFVVYARHATDGESVRLAEDALEIEHRRGARRVVERFNPQWVRVDANEYETRAVRLGESGRAIEVGRYVNAQQRAAFARELRKALRPR